VNERHERGKYLSGAKGTNKEGRGTRPRRSSSTKYRQIPSFSEYILVDTTTRFVELSRRQEDGSWVFGVVSDPEGYVPITAIKARIPMDEIYRNVEFAPGCMG